MQTKVCSQATQSYVFFIIWKEMELIKGWEDGTEV